MHRPTLIEFPPPPPGKTGWPWTEESSQLPETMPGGSPWPHISIVTPSFNQAQFIEETIRSVLMQGYPNLEYIIIDGGSIDGSIEIIKKYEPWMAYWVSERDQGQSHAINKGIQRSKGDILFWLNADDLCMPDAFRLVAQAFHIDPALSLVIGQAHIIDEQSQIIGDLHSRFTSWDELVATPRNLIRQVSTFFARRLFDELGMIDESLHIALDTELLIRFTQFHVPLILDDYLTAYRTHKNAKSFVQIVKGYEEADRVRGKYIPNKKLASTYRTRSASKWLGLSSDDRLTLIDRTKCMLRAIQNQPLILFSRRFLSCSKALSMAILRTAISTVVTR